MGAASVPICRPFAAVGEVAGRQISGPPPAFRFTRLLGDGGQLHLEDLAICFHKPRSIYAASRVPGFLVLDGFVISGSACLKFVSLLVRCTNIATAMK